jgi:hypothetical protein
MKESLQESAHYTFPHRSLIVIRYSFPKIIPVPTAPPKKIQTMSIRLLLGLERCIGTETGSMIVKTGVSCFT